MIILHFVHYFQLLIFHILFRCLFTETAEELCKTSSSLKSLMKRTLLNNSTIFNDRIKYCYFDVRSICKDIHALLTESMYTFLNPFIVKIALSQFLGGQFFKMYLSFSNQEIVGVFNYSKTRRDTSSPPHSQACLNSFSYPTAARIYYAATGIGLLQEQQFLSVYSFRSLFLFTEFDPQHQVIAVPFVKI